VDRSRRFEVTERLGADGSVITALSTEEVRAAVRKLVELGVKTVAICLLHAYINPVHEQQIRDIVAEIAPSMVVSLSSEVHPEFREYDRFSTTVVNAALVPVMSTYLGRLTGAIKKSAMSSEVHVIQSNGGVMSTRAASAAPIATLFSGPSAGVLGAMRLASSAGVHDVITFDMGGTSTDVALIRSGEIPIVHERQVGGKPVLGATVDIHSVGSGGGSIAWIDPGGLLKVGPRSAGAQPGPACYGRGGTQPTVTDANAVLGYLRPESALGGTLEIDVDAARAAIRTHLADPLGLSVEQAAIGVLKVLQADLTRAVRTITVERGSDPRDFVLMPFGGAGGLHAAQLAKELGMDELLVPPSPGVLCAYGALAAETRADFSSTCLADASPAGLSALDRTFTQLELRAEEWLSSEGVGPDAATYSWTLEMRYARQNSQLPVTVDQKLNAETVADAVGRFNDQHHARYGYASPGEPVRVTTVRLAATVPNQVEEVAPSYDQLPGKESSQSDVRRVYFEAHGDYVDCAVFDRSAIRPGDKRRGPAIIHQTDATTVVLPGQDFHIDSFGNLRIED
jgi:N-methylhydantoinase A